MPWVAWLALVGTLAIAGLPPLNGFVSEWLLLQAFLFTPSLPQSFVNMLVPVAAAALVLAVALSAYVMVKFYGVIFLGRPREPHLAHAQDAGIRERAALAALAIGCVLLGIFPVTVITAIDHVNAQLLATTVGRSGESNWLLLAPIATDRSSYSPLIVLAVIVAVVLVTINVVHRLWHGRMRRAPAWRFAGFRCRRRECRTQPRVSGSRSGRSSRADLPDGAPSADAVRHEAALRHGRRSPVALAVPADRADDRRRRRGSPT
jgi:formate hydrogenlyase subunit 3/multisubunit Na+/H+ antiporter MnhD subunit